MLSNDLCPKCGYDYCICNLRPGISNRELTEEEYNYPETDMQVKIKTTISWLDSAGNPHTTTIVED